MLSVSCPSQLGRVLPGGGQSRGLIIPCQDSITPSGTG